MAEHYYVYAIVPGGATLPSGLTGFLNDALTAVRRGDVAAVTSRVDGPILRATAEQIMRHEEIVEAVWHSGPALPVRFGTILPDAASVERALDRTYDALVADLARLGGTVEFGLSVLWDKPEADDRPATTPDTPTEDVGGRGAAYLRARAATMRREEARRTRARILAEKVDGRLGPHALEQRQTLAPTERLAVRIAYLVDREGTRTFRQAFEDLRAEAGSHRLLLSGPWPPYSFVRRDDSVERLLGSVQGGTRGQGWSVEALSQRSRDEEV
jgi:gas vesicle protein GvpL/GvpF